MTPTTTHRIGVLGTGNIFPAYAEGLRRYPELELVRVADTDTARARAAADRYAIPAWGDDRDLYADQGVDIIVNLTPPRLHARTTIAALEAGKHVYAEKPLATTREDGRAILAAAARTGRRVASAPDTVLGSAQRTARAALDAGRIGEVVGATAFVRHSQAETWHPDPAFLFTPGGGPVLDMGPYYLAGLINCLGPIATVGALTRIGAPRRTVTSPERTVDTIEVTVPTHAGAVLGFTSGAIATLQLSFDVWGTELPYLEIYGTSGTLSLPNPNHFDGDVRLRPNGSAEWAVLEPVTALFGALGSAEQRRRGLGVHDLAQALEDGRPHRAAAGLAYHTLDALLAVQEAQDKHAFIDIGSTTEKEETVR